MPKKLKILVVDDSRVVRKAFTKILGADYDVIDVEEGEKAWGLLNQDDDISAVYADLDMPEPNAHTLLERLRSSENKEINAIPFIVIASESDDENSRRIVLDAGATNFISKPFDSVSLTASVKSYAKPNENSLSYIKDATRDPLTQLLNRTYFLTRGNQEISLANRHDVDTTLIFLAIDDFNHLLEVQDRKVIKSLLRGIGAYLLEIVRHEDVIARVDKEVYAVLMPHTDIVGGAEAAARILKSLRSKIDESEFLPLSVRISVGVAATDGTAKQSFESLLEDAEDYLNLAILETGDSFAPDKADAEAIQEGRQKKEKVIDLDEAYALLSSGAKTALTGHESQLLNKVLPIVKFCDQQLDLGLVAELARIEIQRGIAPNGF